MDQHKEGTSLTNQVIEMLKTDSGDFYTEMFKLLFLAIALGNAEDIDRVALRAAAEKRQAAGFVRLTNNCPYVLGNTQNEEMETNANAEEGREPAADDKQAAGEHGGGGGDAEFELLHDDADGQGRDAAEREDRHSDPRPSPGTGRVD